ncbi:hypothetical protein ONZ51_g209 [Trametes cubensis]|uniref:Uncharacterized protein n=1 Tax=Trametes cubensis TaxID=1111947 RepID=A0AAD7XE67_9APHY|nr:hypothetical protein ONZ51_g209 [Trametes cubensis]
MPCNWSTTASLLLRGFHPKASTHFQARLRSSVSQLTLRSWRGTVSRSPLHGVGGLRDLSTNAALLANEESPSSSNDSIESAILSSTSRLSPAQVARAAAQAVRYCIQEGNFGDALYVVNSACHSILQDTLDSNPQRKSQLKPIQFGCAVSPRLASHAFLHGLIRAGYTKKAGTYAQLMIRAGIPIRTKTLESLVSSLVTPPSALPKLGPFARIIPQKPSMDNNSFLHLRSKRVPDLCARAAFSLLQEARTFGQKRTQRMYRVLIDTLLLQGEIVVATLLFVLLIKDFETKLSQKAAQDSNIDDSRHEDYIAYEHLRVSPPLAAALAETPFPNPAIMTDILDVVDRPLSSPTDTERLQSLALLAMLLDTGQIGHPRVAAIVSALYRCPRTDAHVWILRDGKPVRVKAYEYFHAVLKRLIDSLSVKNHVGAVPRFSRRTYNSLLSYALRHRLSPEMASAVLHHMCIVRSPPVMPDGVTYNILLRSGTLLRRMDICEKALAAIEAQPQEHSGTAFVELIRRAQVQSVVATGTSRPSQVTESSSGFSSTLERRLAEAFSLPEITDESGSKFKPDRHTLSSLIVHLTSTGRPHAVAAMIWTVMPELAIVDHPAVGRNPPEHLPRLDRRKALKRAAEYGPHVYASLITALSKAGQIGLAERVFILGQEVERASKGELVPGIARFRLTVHSYTALLQAYATLVFKRKRHDPTGCYLGATLLEQREVVRRRRGPERYGYARFVCMIADKEERVGQRRLTKPQICRRNALLLYRSLMSGGRALLSSLVRNSMVQPRHYTRRDPRYLGYQAKPDARFFNVALRLFAPRRRPLSAGRVRRLQLRTMTRAREDKEAARKSTAGLRMVVRAMHAHGFEIPRGYRHLQPKLKNRDAALAETWKPRELVVRTPYAYPKVRPKEKHPHRLLTFKERGLPIRKQEWRRLRRRTWGPGTADCSVGSQSM